MQAVQKAILAMVLAIGLGSCGGTTMQNSAAPPPATPAHVVIVMEENHGFSEIIGSSQAPYINSLANQGALFTSSFALTHPSEPNYLAIFSGSTQGVTDDNCPYTFTASSLESQLLSAGKSFTGYSEGLPQAGSAVCTDGEYDRKHAPWTDFTADSATDNQPFSSFPTSYANLPVVSFVIPDLMDDMHDGSIQQADAWLQSNLSGYVTWAMNNNSVLIVTWDEDDGTENNQVPTIFVGGAVKPGKYSETINHYNILSTIENLYGLPALANAANAAPITDVWK
jgi:phospholipase C